MAYFINLIQLFNVKHLYKEFNGNNNFYFYKDIKIHTKISINSNLIYHNLFLRKEYWINSSNIS